MTGPGSVVAAVAAAIDRRVAMTSAVAWTHRADPLRPPGQGRRADRRRRLHRRGRRPRAAASRRASARAINDISAPLADTHDRATVDRLTGVANRQALLGALFAEVERASRYERPLCVAFVDIDHFKAVNDSYGHAAGDIVLRGVAQTIAREPAAPATSSAATAARSSC